MKLITMVLIVFNFAIVALWLFAISTNIMPPQIDTSDYPAMSNEAIQAVWMAKIDGFQAGYAIALKYLSAVSLVAFINLAYLLKCNPQK